ncbi:MAG TPA: MBOAT family O-acyltransferase [Polyangiaceae bacterium]
MIFTDFVFFFFFAVTAALYWALRSNRARKLWLLLASYFFYGYWDWRFLGLIFACTVLDYSVGLWLGSVENPRRRRVLIATSLCANLGLLGFFKYYNFFAASGAELFRRLGVPVGQPTLEIVLPAGISFFTFQSMSYTIDVYRRELEPRKSFLDFATFIAFFPQLVAGPIVRAKTFLPQFDAPRLLENVDARRAFVLFASGYFKKACIADNVAAVIDPVFLDPTAYAGADRLLAAVLYSVQIYCDFSGYTDMALATAALLGYELTKNFDAPYFARNLREFWQRWHISLSTWLRDYLYIPLGGNRGSAFRASRNLLLTMLLGGLWHGANWTFVLWGFLHGLGLALHRLWIARVGGSGALLHRAPRLATALSTLFTFAFVAFCFTIFRCPDIGTAFRFFTAETVPSRARPVSLDLWLLVAALGVAHYVIAKRRAWFGARIRAVPDIAFYPALGAVAATFLYFTTLSNAAFIYFQF